MPSLMENLNKEQKEAVTYGNGPLLIVAGAGTGKTTVITKRIAWLIENGKANGDEILALTFTDKAAGEMEERVDRLLPYGYVDLWISTFHAFCDRILRDRALDIGLPNNYRLLNTTEQWMLIKKNLDRFNLDYYKPFGNPTKFIHALLKHFSRCKDEGITPKSYLEYAESLCLNQDNAESGAKVKRISERNGDGLELKRLEEVANAYHTYQQILLENGGLDFGDLINYTLKLFKMRPNVLEIARNKFKYVLVDEFQDTNWAQYELIKLLCAPKNNITCVADDDQAIYLFRGSSVNNVLQFAKDYPECEEIVLTENYRSKQNILDLSYKFIQANNPNRLEYHLNQDDVMRERAKEKGIDLADYKTINKKLRANVGGEAIIEHLNGGTLENEVEAVIGKILEIKGNFIPAFCSKGREQKDLLAENKEITWSDFAILVRANDSAKPFINGLERAGIPYQFYSLRGLYNKPIILDITSFFKLLDNEYEAASLFRVLNIPIWKISHKDFSKINYEAFRQGKSLYHIIKNYAVMSGFDEETIKSLEKITVLIDKHSKMAKEKGVARILTAFLNDSGYLEYLVKNNKVKDLRFLEQFYKKIKDFDSLNDDPKLKSFIEQIEMEIEAGDEGTVGIDLDAGPDMVKIMTIHSAKGLEFPYVFVVNLVDKKFPTIERHDPIEIPEPLVKELIQEGDIHLEEERRLFYVAVTRAKDGLFLTSAEDYGGQRKKKLSRFLAEIGYSIEDNPDATVLPRKISAECGFAQECQGRIFKREFESAADENQYILPKQFSYTQLAAFEKCPLQYKFAHILRIPIKGKSTFSFGKTMHSTLQKFFTLMNEKKNNKQVDLFGKTESENLPTEKDLLKIYEKCWIDEWYENDKEREEKKKSGQSALKEFYNLHKDKWPDILCMEKGFSLKIGNYTLKGNIDRIDSVGDNVEIIDYKTGNFPKGGKLDKSKKKQLYIYQLAAEKVYNLKPSNLIFYYVEANEQVSFLGSPEELIKMEDEIINDVENIISSIKNNDFPHKASVEICKYCDFSDICEHRM